jgi:uncharacterized protein (TIGR00251 family)
VRVQPRARRNEIVEERDGVVLVRVTAPPVDGKANAAICELIARRAGLAPSQVRVVRGAATRDKVVEVEGVDATALRRALALAP